MGDGRFANRPYENGMTGGVVEGGIGPRMREDTGDGEGERFGSPHARGQRDGGRGYIRPGIFSPPVRLPSFWPAIS